VLALSDTARAGELAASVSATYRAQTGRGGNTLVAHASRGAGVTPASA